MEISLPPSDWNVWKLAFVYCITQQDESFPKLAEPCASARSGSHPTRSAVARAVWHFPLLQAPPFGDTDRNMWVRANTIDILGCVWSRTNCHRYVGAKAFRGFARVDSTFPPPDMSLYPFDPLLFKRDSYDRKNLYRSTEPNLITIRIKFHPIFVNRRPLHGRYARGCPYSRRRIDLRFSMFTPNPEYDPARVMRLVHKFSKDLYERYKPRFLQ